VEGFPLTIKTNKPIIGHTYIQVTDPIYSKYTDEVLRMLPNLRIKVFSQKELTGPDGQTINLNNFGNEGCTKVSFADVTNKDLPAVSLDALIPANNEGLLMIYYLKGNSTDNKTKLDTATKNSNTTAGLKVFKTDDLANTSPNNTQLPITIFNNFNTITYEDDDLPDEYKETW
jgi:hypothetical protein